MERPIPILPKQSVTTSGWLSPEGKFYECEHRGHIQLAKEIFCTGIESYETDNIECINHESILELRGWIKVTNGTIIFYKMVISNKKITLRQRSYLIRYFNYKYSNNDINEVELNTAELMIAQI